MSGEYYNYKLHKISIDTLDDLSCRFLLGIPQIERNDMIRVCFAIEEAFWFYIKFSDEDPSLKIGATVRELAVHLFRHVPFLRVHSKNVNEILEHWLEYKISIPTYGAIILNTSCVNGCWGFPKGKINEDEGIEDCAVREVLEETGINIKDDLVSDQYLEEVIGGQTLGLFIVTDINETIRLRPDCRQEIRNIRWFRIASLPRNLTERSSLENTGYPSATFYWVLPFLDKLDQFLESRESQFFKNADEEMMKSFGLPTEFKN